MTEPNRELTDVARYVLRYAGPDGRLYENLHVKPRFFAHGARVAIASANGDEYTLDVDAAKETLIQSSVGASHWWKLSFRAGGAPNGQSAARNPQPIAADERAAVPVTASPFLSFTVPPGHTTVRIRYVDNSFRMASLIALLTLVLLICFMIRARVQRLMDLRRRALRNRDLVRTPLDPGRS